MDVFHTYPRLMKNQEYIVKKGDNLYQISKKFGVSVEELMAKNQMLDTLIYPNQNIVIPRKTENSVYFEEYVIQDNESINSISKNIGINVGMLMKYNDLSKLILNENQILRIPRPNTYLIRDNDTLTSILNEHNLTAEELIIANPEWIQPGRRINLHQKSS